MRPLKIVKMKENDDFTFNYSRSLRPLSVSDRNDCIIEIDHDDSTIYHHSHSHTFSSVFLSLRLCLLLCSFYFCSHRNSICHCYYKLFNNFSIHCNAFPRIACVCVCMYRRIFSSPFLFLYGYFIKIPGM